MLGLSMGGEEGARGKKGARASMGGEEGARGAREARRVLYRAEHGR